MSQFPETDVYNRALSLGVPPEDFVLAGSSAVEVVVGPAVRRAEDIDVAVSPDVYRHLRERSDMQEEVFPDGYRRLVGGGFDITVGWGGRSVEELKQGGYQHNGLYVAGLPDVYQRKQERGLPKDGDDLRIIRDRLYGDQPLPPAMLEGEMSFLRSCVPERLHDRPELQVAANGLMIVRTVFGDEKEGVRTYSGTFENAAVPATYHAWGHSALGTRDGQRSMQLENAERARQGLPPAYPDEDHLAHAAGFSNHDAILGHGRQAANPTGHDERQAADLVARHLAAVGASDYVQEGAHATVMATTFNEAKKAQDIDPARGYVHLQEMGAGSDMAAFRRAGVEGAVALTVEDLFRKGAAYDQPLQRLVDQLNANLPAGARPITVRTVEDGLRLIDEHPDFPVVKSTPDGPQEMTLKEAYVSHLRGSSGFAAGYKFPERWRLGTPKIQAENAASMGRLADRVEQGESSVLDTYTAAKSLSTSQETVIRDPGIQGVGETLGTGTAISVAELKSTIEQLTALLPVEQLEAAAPVLQEAYSRLASIVRGSTNEHTASAEQALASAQERLNSVRRMLATVIDELTEYRRHLG